MKNWLCALLLTSASFAHAQTAQDLLNDGKNTDHITTYGSYDHKRYSPLRQINTSNIKRLVPVWNTTLSNLLGEQAQPLVYNGVMYVTNAAWTFAIDITNGRQTWRTAVDYDPGTPRVVCCGVSNKGAAILNGKLYRTTLDAHVVALDMKTGKQLWKQKFAEWKEGYSSIAAPLIANGVLITGMSGAEFGVRGFLDGWDPETGKQLWRRYTVPGPGEKGFETWPQDNDAYKRGGATTWVTGSYDPELDLTYWGTGNTGPWNPKYRHGDSLYAASVIAVRPKTGMVYLNTINFPQMVKYVPTEYKPGARYVGVEGRPFPRPAGEDAEGWHNAMDPLTGKVKWEIKLTDSVTQAGMLSTDGGLVFTGRMSGEFLAIDEASGKVLWQFQTGSGVNAPAVTYTHKGRQYITVLSGIAGDSRGRRAAARVPSGGSVWTFALMPE